MGLFGKGLWLALQNIVFVMNCKNSIENLLVMYSPVTLSLEQQRSLSRIYSELKKFTKFKITIPFTHLPSDCIIYDDLDFFYKQYGIDFVYDLNENNRFKAK